MAREMSLWPALGSAFGSTFALFLTASTHAAALEPYKWAYRPLLVFAGSASLPNFQVQTQLSAEQKQAFQDRDIVVITVVGNTVSTSLGPNTPVDAAELRRRYRVASGEFKAILVGKDGGVKLSSAEPISSKQLFETIDVMPMRKREMR